MFDRVNPGIVSDHSEDWQSTRELLGVENDKVGVFSLEEGTEVMEDSANTVPVHGFRVGSIDAVKGNYVVFPEEIVQGLDQRIHGSVLGPEDMNDANFYFGQSTGVPWFELKFEGNYAVPDDEAPHLHDEAWEFYGLEGGGAVLDVANRDYDFNDTSIDDWDLRDGVSQINVFDGDAVAVPPGLPHQVNVQYGDPDLLIAKYSSLGLEGDIGKYTIEGKRVDSWAEENEEINIGNKEALH